jgi:hypothetical protein
MSRVEEGRRSTEYEQYPRSITNFGSSALSLVKTWNKQRKKKSSKKHGSRIFINNAKIYSLTWLLIYS